MALIEAYYDFIFASWVLGRKKQDNKFLYFNQVRLDGHLNMIILKWAYIISVSHA